jgi:hypothetical protein
LCRCQLRSGFHHPSEACTEASESPQEIKTERLPGVYEAISWHPDIMLHHIGGRSMVYAPGTSASILGKLYDYGFELIEGKSILLSKYPFDIAYNIARVGNFAFHNLEYTDPVIKNLLESQGVELVHIKQGYAKCSISIVDENSIISSDAGIAKAAAKKGLEVLLIPPEENIMLPGLNNGFLGGSTGLLEKNIWAVSGDAGKLKSYTGIKSFLDSKNIAIKSLSNSEVTDIGSILPLLTV